MSVCLACHPFDIPFEAGPTRRILVACEFGQISTLAAATLRELGYAALDGGMKAWRQSGLPVSTL
jgi:rhodanese-related sulfurtransferase